MVLTAPPHACVLGLGLGCVYVLSRIDAPIAPIAAHSPVLHNLIWIEELLIARPYVVGRVVQLQDAIKRRTSESKGI